MGRTTSSEGTEHSGLDIQVSSNPAAATYDVLCLNSDRGQR